MGSSRGRHNSSRSRRFSPRPSPSRRSPQNNQTERSPANSTTFKQQLSSQWPAYLEKFQRAKARSERKKSHHRDSKPDRQRVKRPSAEKQSASRVKSSRRPSSKKPPSKQEIASIFASSTCLPPTTEDLDPEVERPTDKNPEKKLFWPENLLRLPPSRRVFYPRVLADGTEAAVLDGRVHYSKIRFATTQPIFFIECTLTEHTHSLSTTRSRSDPWRQYGALKSVHKTGGWTFMPNHRKADRKMKLVGPGEPMTDPKPTTKPILTFQDFLDRRASITSTKTPTFESAETGTEDTVIDDEVPATSQHSSSLVDQRRKTKRWWSTSKRR